MAYGFKDFTAGDVLTAAQVDDYLQRQAVMQFDDSTARDAALTVSIVREGMVAYLLDTDLFTVYTGSAWINFGGIGGWISYTPTWSGTTGNGAVAGKYMREGRTIHFRATVTWGSTSSHGGGAQTLTLPSAPHADYVTNAAVNASVVCKDATAGITGAFAYISSGSALGFLTHAAGNVNNTGPFTWTTSDVLYVAGSYESAA